MAQNSWPFYSGSTGTPVLEDQWSIMARRWAQSGVESYANNLEVYGDSSGRQVKIKTGRACVRGHWYENTAEVTLAIAANSSGNPRIDRIVLKLDPSADSIVLAVVQGTAAGSPSAPSLTQTDVAVYEMTLAQVAVANGASTITAANVTDERTFVDGVWRSYTPTLKDSTGATLANWTCTGAWTRIGNFVSVKFDLTASSSPGSGTGVWRINLPATAVTTGPAPYATGTVWISDNSPAAYTMARVSIDASTYFGIWYVDAAVSGAQYGLQAARPITWAASDRIVGAFMYEAA